jgi:transcriptional regulator with XRE-family HTH domain
MSRIKSLRVALGWTQTRMAEHLGLDQSSISAMERGQRESGPVSKLLDLLEQELPSPGPSPVGVSADGTPERGGLAVPTPPRSGDASETVSGILSPILC